MDKNALMTHILKSKGTSTLLGGEPSVSVINNKRYISPLTNEAQDGHVEDSSSSVDHAVHTALSHGHKNVILVGPEGSGKTTALEKLVVDWAKGEHLQNFSYVLHFELKQLSSLNGSLVRLETLMLHHHPPIPPESMPLIMEKPEEVLFVFDDLDWCLQKLDPSVQTLSSDPNEAVSLSYLVASLLHGFLLKGAVFVVAIRPTECVKFLSGTQVEVLGFLKPQREVYFNRFFADPAAASKARMHMERTLGFYDICTSPRFCWTVCSMYKSLMDAGAKLPETISQLCIDILVHLIQTLSLKEACNRELVLALGKMASHCYLGQHSICTNKEMDSFGLQQYLDLVGIFLQIDGDQSDRQVFSFHSQLMQDFFLASAFFLDKSSSEGVEKMLEKHKSRAKFLDVFLSALSDPVQRRPLETLLGEMNSDRIMDFKRWFKTSSEMSLKHWNKTEHYHCFHLLHQAQNESWVREIITSSARIGMSYGDMSLKDCVALNYVVTCLGEMAQLNLYMTRNLTEDKAKVLAPTISLSHSVNLSHSSLSTGAVPHLASAVSRGITKELNLSQSHIGYEKFKTLCNGLRECKLQSLNLQACNLTEASCDDLVSVLTSGTSQLCLLDMRWNEIGDKGFIQLCRALHSPHCKLQELQLQSCKLTLPSMEALSAALCSGQSQLRKVNLTHNKIGNSGVGALCKSLQHPLCKLQSLDLFDSELSGECCPYLMEALMSEHCTLSELDLSVNELGQEGALLLCKALSRPECQIKKLGLCRCQLTELVFKELGVVLRSGTSQLKSLTVGLNKVGDQGVKHLLDAVAHPNCLLEELDVEMTGLTDATVKDLCAAIRASKTLKSLELRNNSLTDVSVPALVQVMQDSQNMLEMNLRYNEFSEEVFAALEECNKIRY